MGQRERKKSRSVSLELRGGLGNQLATVASSMILYPHKSKEFRFLVTGSNASRSDSIQALGFKVVGVPHQDRALLGQFLHKTLRKIRALIGWDSRLWWRRFREKILRELFISGDSEDWLRKNLVEIAPRKISGFFADCAYFEKLPVAVGDLFSLDGQPRSEWLRTLQSEATSVKPIGLHVRRGDYLRRADSTLGVQYYLNALQFLSEKGIADENKCVWIFSDDPNFVKEEFARSLGGWSVRYVEPPPTVPAAEVMFLMASCQLLVSANSTFSWWAAHLSESIDAVVVPPADFPLNPWGTCCHSKLFQVADV